MRCDARRRGRPTCAAAAPVSHTHTTARERPLSRRPARTAAESSASGMRSVSGDDVAEAKASPATMPPSPPDERTSMTSGGAAEATMAASSAALTSLCVAEARFQG